MTTKIGIVGAAGRMGRTLIEEVSAAPGTALAGATERPGHEAIGQDAGTLAGVKALGIKIGDKADALFAESDVVIDFTAPQATLAHLALAAKHKTALVIGTTGLLPDDLETIEAAAKTVPIMRSANMSLGVNLLLALTERVAKSLGPDYDIEILEMHHKHKVDAPSGTALLLAEAAAEGRKIKLEERSIRARDGHTGARPQGAIGFASLRGGSVVGEHSVIFAGQDERIELGHIAQSRDIFARGAVKAALWAFERKPGLYSMADVLGISEE